MNNNMEVIKRNGRIQAVHFDKITERISNLCKNSGLNMNFIDPIKVAKEVIGSMVNRMHTSELDLLSAKCSATFITDHPDYSYLASKILVSNLHKNTHNNFSDAMEELYNYFNETIGDKCPLISEEVYNFVMKHKDILNNTIIDDRDLSNYNYLAYSTLEKNYLLKINGNVVERPQYMLMRVSLGIHLKSDYEVNIQDEDILERAIETYNLMSNGFMTHATPTLFHFGTKMQTGSSCFLLECEDSIDEIGKCQTQCMKLMKYAGGIGIHFSKVRANGSYIKSSNGKSSGIVPWLRILNQISKGVNQSGKRPGSIAVYLEPWHADIFEFLQLKRNVGNEDDLARSLFYALWMPDEFFRRLEKKQKWSLFCPNECPGLVDSYGEKFTKLYKKYERDPKKVRKQIDAEELWREILKSQIETGVPYLLNKDACNEKNNQKNLGTLKGSNLCAEILIYTNQKEVGTCNLASIALSRFVKFSEDKPYFDFGYLEYVSGVCCKNLNRVIDRTNYTLQESQNSNLRHRPIAIGVQGLHDTFMKMGLVFTSEEARKLNIEIFETIYYGAMKASIELAKKDGKYDSFSGSPMSEGLLQFDLAEKYHNEPAKFSGRYNWSEIRKKVVKYGLRNSLLTALMPTASTSNILGQTECIEAVSSNFYYRRGVFGECCVINRYMVNDLIKLGLWTQRIKNKIRNLNGSIQEISEIPKELKEKYLTMWEIKKKPLIEMSADRGYFIDQTQSFNIYVEEPKYNILHSIHMYSWRKGLKTISYYIRSKPTISATKINEINNESEICVMEDGCLTCSS